MAYMHLFQHIGRKGSLQCTCCTWLTASHCLMAQRKQDCASEVTWGYVWKIASQSNCQNTVCCKSFLCLATGLQFQWWLCYSQVFDLFDGLAGCWSLCQTFDSSDVLLKLCGLSFESLVGSKKTFNSLCSLTQHCWCWTHKLHQLFLRHIQQCLWLLMVLKQLFDHWLLRYYQRPQSPSWSRFNALPCHGWKLWWRWWQPLTADTHWYSRITSQQFWPHPCYSWCSPGGQLRILRLLCLTLTLIIIKDAWAWFWYCGPQFLSMKCALLCMWPLSPWCSTSTLRWSLAGCSLLWITDADRLTTNTTSQQNSQSLQASQTMPPWAVAWQIAWQCIILQDQGCCCPSTILYDSTTLQWFSPVSEAPLEVVAVAAVVVVQW